MWRRWASREPEIGDPTLIETTMDERYLETIPEVESLKSKRSSMAAALPDLPFRAVPPMKDRDYNRNRESTVSSIYSQPDYSHYDDQDTVPKSMPGHGEISPLSTPRSSINPPTSEKSLVSPVEPTFTIPPRAPHPEQTYKSQIPVPAVSTIQNPKSGNHGNKEETRWDTYSGEPTQSEAGKPASVRPSQGPVEFQYPQLKERTKLILAGLRERDTAKKTPWGKPPPPVEADPLDNPIHREPWKGASGRTTLVEPVKNTPAARKGPVHFPQRNVSRQNAPDVTSSQSRTQFEPVVSTPPDLAEHPAFRTQTPPEMAVPDLSIRVVPSQESIKPVVPLKLNSPRVASPTLAVNMGSLQSPFQSPPPTIVQNHQDANGYAQPVLEPVSHHEHIYEHIESPTPPATPIPYDTTSRDAQNPHTLQPAYPEREESRFSWTTYATTVNESPRSMAPTHGDDNSVPPMPPIPAPIVVRKRPISTVVTNILPYSSIGARQSSGDLLCRKPVNTERSRSVSIMSSNTKSLPPTPVEMQAGDKMSTLEARLGDLSRRKRNNSKITREVTENLKRNVIAYDTRKRKEMEQVLVSLGCELDEITREEHEVGLSLHRAQKKRDREDGYEKPTGLWIKRVTS